MSLVAVLLALAAIGAVAWLPDRTEESADWRLARAEEAALAYLPHAAYGPVRAATSVATLELPSPSPQPTSEQSPTTRPSAEPSPTSRLADQYVLIQVASFGGLAPDTPFGVDLVRISPWYTLYADDHTTPWDGQVLTVPHVDGSPDHSTLLIGNLGQHEVETLRARLADEVAFWELQDPDESGLCVTDLDTTAVYASAESPLRLDRTVLVYGLDWYLRGESPCRPRSGTPAPPDPRLVALAGFVAELRQPPTQAEPFLLDAAALVVTRDRPYGDAPEWPLSYDLVSMAPMPLQPAVHDLAPGDVTSAMDAVREARRPGWTMARFAQGEERFVVGVRPEPRHWWVYGADPGSADPGCPPVAPKCTPGPPPTPCAGPGCPTPVPCPCDP